MSPKTASGPQADSRRETDAAAHKLLVGDSSDLSGKKVGAALQRLGAYGAEKAVPTHVLATELFTPTPNQSLEEQQASIQRMGRMLAAASARCLFSISRVRTQIKDDWP